jgi:hypothetical protein
MGTDWDRKRVFCMITVISSRNKLPIVNLIEFRQKRTQNSATTGVSNLRSSLKWCNYSYFAGEFHSVTVHCLDKKSAEYFGDVLSPCSGRKKGYIFCVTNFLLSSISLFSFSSSYSLWLRTEAGKYVGLQPSVRDTSKKISYVAIFVRNDFFTALLNVL